MNNADAALARQRDRQVRFCDGVHGGADDRNVQADGAAQTRASVGLGWNDAATSGYKEDVVEGQSFGDVLDNHIQ